MNTGIVLYEKKEKCCGCGTCKIVCPQNAITMEKDSYDFLYPVINMERCIDCGLCKKICTFQQGMEKNFSPKVYALALKNLDELLQSASGGVFGGIAKQWIIEGGVTFGAAFVKDGEHLTLCHSLATTGEELKRQLGSKYVQSDLGDTFIVVKELLQKGKKVLYSGTPCQIVGLKSYLGKDYSNLVTMDLVCHGVAACSMFQGYLKAEGEKIGSKIENFVFRDKELGWGLNAKLYYNSPEGKIASKVIPSYESSYYELFLHGDIYRDSCYNCPYANKNHPADMTLGDFWGIEKEHPEYLEPNGKLNQSVGVSMLMINSKKGEAVFDSMKDLFWYYPSSFEIAARNNEQLRKPSSIGEKRQKILELYKEKGYDAVDKWFWKQKKTIRRRENIKYYLHKTIPEPIRVIVKMVLRRY